MQHSRLMSTSSFISSCTATLRPAATADFTAAPGYSLCTARRPRPPSRRRLPAPPARSTDSSCSTASATSCSAAATSSVLVPAAWCVTWLAPPPTRPRYSTLAPARRCRSQSRHAPTRLPTRCHPPIPSRRSYPRPVPPPARPRISRKTCLCKTKLSKHLSRT